MMRELYFSLGSNIEPRLAYLKFAVRELSNYFQFDCCSSLYQTSACDDVDQEDFFNLCVKFFTSVEDPYRILKIIHEIESRIGRRRDKSRPKGPRVIDIDILFFGDVILQEEQLTIPHKSLLQRNFVLIPMAEIGSAELLEKYRVREGIEKNKEQKVTRIGELKFE